MRQSGSKQVVSSAKWVVLQGKKGRTLKRIRHYKAQILRAREPLGIYQEDIKIDVRK
jgi:hypothetical protein